MKSLDNFSPLKEFISPTCGRLSLDEVFLKLVGFINEDEGQLYNLIIGTDSFLSADTLFVSAIIIHRVGHGGRYYYKRNRHRKIKSMRQRIQNYTQSPNNCATFNGVTFGDYRQV